MSSTRDKIEKGAANVVVALGLWERLSAWWSKRREAKAEKLRIRDVDLAIETKRKLEEWSDDANRDRGECPEPGCDRPRLHPGEHRP